VAYGGVQVASLYLAKIGIKLTKMTPEQSKYLGVPKHRPFEATPTGIEEPIERSIP